MLFGSQSCKETGSSVRTSTPDDIAGWLHQDSDAKSGGSREWPCFECASRNLLRRGRCGLYHHDEARHFLDVECYGERRLGVCGLVRRLQREQSVLVGYAQLMMQRLSPTSVPPRCRRVPITIADSSWTAPSNAWGRNNEGQLGRGTTQNAGNDFPQTVTNLTNVVQVAAGGYHTCVLLVGGRCSAGEAILRDRRGTHPEPTRSAHPAPFERLPRYLASRSPREAITPAN
jgi:hypothetical protein